MLPSTEAHPAALARLIADDLLCLGPGGHRTTRRWQRAMARAAWQLFSAGDSGEDLRVPIAAALVEFYGQQLDDDAIADMVEVLLPIEAREINPRELLQHRAAERMSASPPRTEWPTGTDSASTTADEFQDLFGAGTQK